MQRFVRSVRERECAIEEAAHGVTEVEQLLLWSGS